MSPLSPRSSRAALPRHALVIALFAVMSLSSCGGADDDGAEGDNRSEARTRPPSPTPTAREHNAGPSGSTPVRISFGDTQLTARLHDNATARDLAAQLPLAISFRDHNGVEKTGPLPRELSLDEAPAGHDPIAGDIGYWAPDGDLVLYYDDAAPYWNGIVGIGGFDGVMAAVKRLPEDTRVTIERTG
jgi:hypothetical protein